MGIYVNPQQSISETFETSDTCLTPAMYRKCHNSQHSQTCHSPQTTNQNTILKFHRLCENTINPGQ